VISPAIGRGKSDGDGSAAGGADFSALSPQQVGSTGQQKEQQRRLSKRHAEAGSTESKQTLVQARAIFTSFRSRFMAKSSTKTRLESQARLGFLRTLGVVADGLRITCDILASGIVLMLPAIALATSV
jgi:hypothetical protein